MKKLSWHFLISALPLLIYPFVFVASIMSLAGGLEGGESISLLIVAQIFLWSSLCYPLAFGVAVIGAIFTEGKTRKKWIYLPYWYLGFVILSFVLWGLVSA